MDTINASNESNENNGISKRKDVATYDASSGARSLATAAAR